jgi:hypothetical protein
MWQAFMQAARKDPEGVEEVLSVAADLPRSDDRDAAGGPDVRDELAMIVEWESGWKTDAVNPVSKATGLIQFMPTTAKWLGTTTEELRAMNLRQQAHFVRKYYRQVLRGKKLSRPGDLYLATFYPGAMGQEDDFVIASATHNAIIWKQNPSLRDGPEGPITAGAVRAKGTPKKPLPPIPSTPRPKEPEPPPVVKEPPTPDVPAEPVKPDAKMSWFQRIATWISRKA